MITIDGISGAWNYTIGPVVVWEGLKSLDKINFRELPCIVVGKYIPVEQLAKIDFPRVLGFVLEEGGPGDPTLIIFSNQHRATVLRAAGAVAQAKDGETIVVDGVNGKVFFEPDEETLEKYRVLRKQGPPPEPPGMIEKLMRVATDFKSLDPSAIKSELIPFREIGAAMDGVLAAWRAERLNAKQLADLKKFAKGTPVEGNILKNLERFEKLMDEREAEAGAAEKAAAEKAEPVTAGRGRAASAAEERRKARDEGRTGRGEETATGASSSAATATESAAAGKAGSATSVSAETMTSTAGATAAPASAAEERRLKREQEIAAARAARRGGEDKK